MLLPQGVLTGSDMFFYTPSQMALSQLYYFTSIGRFFCESNYSVDRGDYGNFLLVYVERGTLQVRTGGKVYSVHKGESAFIDCHKPHGYWPLDSVDFSWLHFDGQNTAELHRMATEVIHDSPVFKLKESKDFFKQMLNTVFEMKYHPVNSEYKDSLAIYKLLVAMLMDQAKPPSAENGNDRKVSGTMVDDAIHFIEENLQENLSVADIASHVGLSESHFTRKFRAVTNTSPKDYLIRRRLTRAKLLLKTTEIPIKEIAFQVGFNSESHFTNSFTGLNGLSPKEFRKLKI